MKCTNCGTENQYGVTFCANCGIALTGAAAAEVSSAAPSPVLAGAAVGNPGTPGIASAPPPARTPSVTQSQSHAQWTDGTRAGLQNATSRLDAVARPYQQRLAPIQNALAPLESVGRQMLAWIGSALIVVGLFLPIKTWTVSLGAFSGSGSDSYWGMNTFGAVVFLALALAAAGLAYLRLYVWLWLIGAFLLLFFLFGFINSFMSGISGVGAHPSWGWILLFPGVLALLASPAMRDPGTSRVA